MKKPKPKPTPARLTPEALAWYRELDAEYGIGDDPAGRLLLQTSCEAFDRMREAQALLERDGAVVPDRWGQLKPHPAAAMERDARSAMLAGLRALNLDVEPLGRVGRPAGERAAAVRAVR
jgi:P27 family predicted phage terminase small subunit